MLVCLGLLFAFAALLLAFLKNRNIYDLFGLLKPLRLSVYKASWGLSDS